MPQVGSAHEATALLQLVGIEKSFGAVQALRHADLAAKVGEIVGVCGDNGAGKSTLVKILAGVYPYGSYRGEILLNGRVQQLASPADTRRAGIAVVHQKLMLVPQLSVAQNLMLGREPRRFGLVDEARLESQALAHLARFGFSDQISPAALVEELGIGLRQILEIIRALSHDARILVLDEPAALLLPHERDRLFEWLRRLKKVGTTCIYVSHRMDEMMVLCDQITVLRDGRTAHTLSSPPATRRSVRGRYIIDDEIAAGGMATVHLGKVVGPFGFTSTVAIKRLHASLAKDPQFVAMFLDEARLASRVRHPNVVPVLDVFVEDGDLSLVMEYVEGESLSQLCRLMQEARRAVPVSVAVAITISMLHGLHAAHEARDERGALLGIVHRDVSPQNVIVGIDGVVRLIDFGIAKAAGRCNVSRDGQLKGKVAYMAPEQLERGIVNRRTDVYGASVLLWELFTGERLFVGETEGMVLGRVLDDVVPPPSSLRAEVGPVLDAITLRGLDRRQEQRFDSARAMARELEAAMRPATNAEVGDWVQSIAHVALAERREKLARLELSASTDAADELERDSWDRGSNPATAAATSTDPARSRLALVRGAVARLLSSARTIIRRGPPPAERSRELRPVREFRDRR
jgi:ABC-type multidrug transport system ATPase subunit